MGWRSGRKRARPGTPAPKALPKAAAKAKAKAVPKAAPAPRAPAVPAAPAAAPVVPVGRQNNLGMEVLSVSEWYTRMITDVGSAREIVLATYMYDHTGLQQVSGSQQDS